MYSGGLAGSSHFVGFREVCLEYNCKYALWTRYVYWCWFIEWPKGASSGYIVCMEPLLECLFIIMEVRFLILYLTCTCLCSSGLLLLFPSSWHTFGFLSGRLWYNSVMHIFFVTRMSLVRFGQRRRYMLCVVLSLLAFGFQALLSSQGNAFMSLYFILVWRYIPNLSQAEIPIIMPCTILCTSNRCCKP